MEVECELLASLPMTLLRTWDQLELSTSRPYLINRMTTQDSRQGDNCSDNQRGDGRRVDGKLYGDDSGRCNVDGRRDGDDSGNHQDKQQRDRNFHLSCGPRYNVLLGGCLAMMKTIVS